MTESKFQLRTSLQQRLNCQSVKLLSTPSITTTLIHHCNHCNGLNRCATTSIHFDHFNDNDRIQARDVKRLRRQTCGCNQLEQLQPWIGELCICIPKSSLSPSSAAAFSMSCSCPQVQQELQQSKRCGCSLHEHIGQQCRAGCQQSCNIQCNPYMPRMHCNNACLDACMQSCNLDQQHQQQYQQFGSFPYWYPYIPPLQHFYPNLQQHLQPPITEKCILCITGCEQMCNIQRPFFDDNRSQCECMQQCQPSCSSNLQSQPLAFLVQQQQHQCMPNCQQNCQQFCNHQRIIDSQQCQPQCKQQCANLCTISPESQYPSMTNSLNYPSIHLNPPAPSYHHIQPQNCFASCFDSCKQSCGQQSIRCTNPCTQNCQQFCNGDQQQQPIPVLQQQPNQQHKPQIIRIDLHGAMLDSMQCIPQCQQSCLQQCNTNLMKAQCQPACQTICEQNCGHRQVLSPTLSQQQQQLTQCQQTPMIHCYCPNDNIPCHNGSQCCKKR